MTETTPSGGDEVAEDAPPSAPPTDAKLLHLSASVLLSWNELSLQDQVKILA